MGFIVVYDACVLFPAPLRDLLLRVAASGIVAARWTDEILDEVFSNLILARPDLDPGRLARTRCRMCEAIDDCLVTGYQGLADPIALPDPNDRHVLAAALRCSAQTIVTTNLKDFPRDLLGPLRVQAQHPDEFVHDLIDLAPGVVLAAVKEQALALRNPPVGLPELLDTLERHGLMRSVAALRSLLGLEES